MPEILKHTPVAVAEKQSAPTLPAHTNGYHELAVTPRLEQDSVLRETVASRLREILAAVETGRISDTSQLLLGIVIDGVRAENGLSPSIDALPEPEVTTVAEAQEQVSQWRVLRRVTTELVTRRIKEGSARAVARFNAVRAQGVGNVITREYLRLEDTLREMGRDTIVAGQNAINEAAQTTEDIVWAAQSWQQEQETRARNAAEARRAQVAAERQRLSQHAVTPAEQQQLTELHASHQATVAAQQAAIEARRQAAAVPDNRTPVERLVQPIAAPLESGSSRVGTTLTDLIERAKAWQRRQDERAATLANSRSDEQTQPPAAAVDEQANPATSGNSEAQPITTTIDTANSDTVAPEVPSNTPTVAEQSQDMTLLDHVVAPVGQSLETPAQWTAARATRMLNRIQAWQQQREADGQARRNGQRQVLENRQQQTHNQQIILPESVPPVIKMVEDEPVPSTPLDPEPAKPEPPVEPRFVASIDDLKPIKVRKSDRRILDGNLPILVAEDTPPVLEQAAAPIIRRLENVAKKLGNFVNETAERRRENTQNRAELELEKKRQANASRVEMLSNIDASDAQSIINALAAQDSLSEINIRFVIERNTPQLSADERQALLDETFEMYTDMRLNLGATELATQFAHQFINEANFQFSTDAIRKAWNQAAILGNSDQLRQLAMQLLREDRQFIEDHQGEITEMIEQLQTENPRAVTTQRVRQLIEAQQFGLEVEHRQRAIEAYILQQVRTRATQEQQRPVSTEVQPQRRTPIQVAFGGLRRFSMPTIGRKKAA